MVHVLLRIVAVLAAVSVVFTLRFIVAFASAGGLRSLVATGLLGVLTLLGWVLSVVLGPLVTIQLWRYKESGRLAAVVLFGYGLTYYVMGLLFLRAPGSHVFQIGIAMATYALPLFVVLSPSARRICTDSRR